MTAPSNEEATAVAGPSPAAAAAAPKPAKEPKATAMSDTQRAQLENEVAALRRQLEDKEALLIGAASMAGKKASKKGKENALETDPVQGCRDFPPEDMRMREYLFGKFHAVAKQFGFEAYDAPMLESEVLYTRKAGEEITEQMFNFVTKGGHRVAMRPEMTPSLARLILAKGRALMLPVKWYSIPQCWRYEAISRGRKREHYQWNMDIVGVKSVSAEAELVCALCATMESLGLTSKDVGIKVNSRKILQCIAEGMGVSKEQFGPVCIIVDKMEKLPREEIVAQLRELGLDESAVDGLTAALSVKNLDDVVARLGSSASAEALNVVAELRDFFSFVQAYGYGDWVQFDASVVRGLAYYTGIVFEGFDRAGQFRAVCGGGRYDNLLTTYGAPQPIPCCGFGFGDCVIMEMLEEKKLLPKLDHVVDDVVIPLDESMRQQAVQVLQLLRSKGRNCDIVLDKKKVAQAFNFADRVGAVRAVLVAPDEWAQGKVQIKMLREGEGKGGAAAAAASASAEGGDTAKSGERGSAVLLSEL